MDIACILAGKDGIEAIDRARKLKIPVEIVDQEEFRGSDGKVDEYGFGQAMLKVFRKHGATVVMQNGWLPHTPTIVIDAFPNMIFNQHPGPVPEFGGKGMYGRRVHAARLLFTRMTKRDLWTDAIAQRVHRDFDQGAVVKSTRVDILTDDTVDDLQQRVLPVEHRVQIDLLKDVASGRVRDITQRESLVKPGEEQIIFLAKKMARFLYPRG